MEILTISHPGTQNWIPVGGGSGVPVTRTCPPVPLQIPPCLGVGIGRIIKRRLYVVIVSNMLRCKLICIIIIYHDHEVSPSACTRVYSQEKQRYKNIGDILKNSWNYNIYAERKCCNIKTHELLYTHETLKCKTKQKQCPTAVSWQGERGAWGNYRPSLLNFSLSKNFLVVVKFVCTSYILGEFRRKTEILSANVLQDNCQVKTSHGRRSKVKNLQKMKRIWR